MRKTNPANENLSMPIRFLAVRVLFGLNQSIMPIRIYLLLVCISIFSCGIPANNQSRETEHESKERKKGYIDEESELENNAFKDFFHEEKVYNSWVRIALLEGTSWREPSKEEHQEALELTAIHDGVIVSERWYDRISNSLVDSIGEHDRFAEGNEKSDLNDERDNLRSGFVTIPAKLTFYGENGEKANVFDIVKNNHYLKELAPGKVVCYFCSELERGWASEKERREYLEKGENASYYELLTEVIKIERSARFTAILYTTIALNKEKLRLGKEQTLIIFDKKGSVIGEVRKSKLGIWHVLVTRQGKYLVLNVGGEENINSFNEKSPDGIVIMEISSNSILYSEYSGNSNQTYGWAYLIEGFVKTDIRRKEEEGYAQNVILFDLENRMRYEREFSNQEVNLWVEYNMNGGTSDIDFLFSNFNFTKTKI